MERSIGPVYEIIEVEGEGGTQEGRVRYAVF